MNVLSWEGVAEELPGLEVKELYLRFGMRDNFTACLLCTDPGALFDDVFARYEGYERSLCSFRSFKIAGVSVKPGGGRDASAAMSLESALGRRVHMNGYIGFHPWDVNERQSARVRDAFVEIAGILVRREVPFLTRPAVDSGNPDAIAYTPGGESPLIQANLEVRS